MGLLIFIVFIMIGTSFSVFFIGTSPQKEVVRYKGLKFVSRAQDNIWIVKINGKEAAFTFLPEEVENIRVPNGVIEKLQNKFEIDVTSDLNSTFKESIALAQHQMGLTFGMYNIYVRKGFTSNNSFGFPIITCDNATSNAPVIYFKQGNETRINLDTDCIIANSLTNSDLIRVKDRLLYGIFGVIK